MKTSELQILFGALLHDIGKIIFRTGLSVTNHSELGFNYLKDQIGIVDQAILNCVRFHHKSLLKIRDLPMMTEHILFILQII